MSPSERHNGPVIEVHFQFLAWHIPTVDKFRVRRNYSSMTAFNPLSSMCWSHRATSYWIGETEVLANGERGVTEVGLEGSYGGDWGRVKVELSAALRFFCTIQFICFTVPSWPPRTLRQSEAWKSKKNLA